MSLKALVFTDPDHIKLNKEREERDFQESKQIIKELIPYRDPNELKQRLLPVIRQSILTFLNENHEYLGNDDELKLTILVTWSFVTQNPMIAVLVSYLQQQEMRPCHIELRNYTRSAKEIKDSLWVQSREQLERQKSPQIHEIVMYDAQGRISEGISSNFLIMMNDQFYTAPHGQVLWGTVLNLMMDLCQQEGLPVVFDYPRLSDLDRWQGVIITSTSRLMMLVTEVSVPELGVYRAFEKPLKILEHLQNLVRNHIKQRAFPLFLNNKN
jgi:branched-subunit amino acid aminotransferase/4-amino-4-deoxychorismate lyase